MLSDNTIKPNKGYGKIEFGMDMERLAELVGEPEEIVSLDDDEELNIVVLHYWEQGFSVFMDGITRQVVAGIETEHADAELYNTKIIGMSEEDAEGLLSIAKVLPTLDTRECRYPEVRVVLHGFERPYVHGISRNVLSLRFANRALALGNKVGHLATLDRCTHTG